MVILPVPNWKAIRLHVFISLDLQVLYSTYGAFFCVAGLMKDVHTCVLCPHPALGATARTSLLLNE